ncbi:hypothetical protein [Methylobacterium sp. WL8]|uniref:hypothetical protein n=1 Tax=Methylobacterium sp. WL8 TaxID=2603899 RepID=UPI0011C85B6D|nr:hypothetical protein [Methylobacterium sp. WL8]TXN81959.1 hypothetical protein FV234_11465 [Methylobacterium sp. WL8]
MSAGQSSGSPENSRSANPSDISDRSSQARLVLEPITKDIGAIRDDIKEINNNRHDDVVKILIMFGGGFLILAAMVLTIYSKLDDKIATINDRTIKVDTKLEELIKRIPPSITAPVTTPPARR